MRSPRLGRQEVVRTPRTLPGRGRRLHANCPSTTTAACASTAHGGRPQSRHDFGLCHGCRSRPPAQPPRLRPVQRLPITAVSKTATASACDATAGHGRRLVHLDCGLCLECSQRPSAQLHDFGLCDDCRSQPSVQPPRLRPLLLLLITAVYPTTTASACAATAHHRRPSNHHDFGQYRYCPSRPSVQPPRLRLAGPRASATWTVATNRPPRFRPLPRLPTSAVSPTTTTSACAATAHSGRPCNHHDFGL